MIAYQRPSALTIGLSAGTIILIVPGVVLATRYGGVVVLAVSLISLFVMCASRPAIALGACLIVFFMPMSVAEVITVGGLDVRLFSLPLIACIALAGKQASVPRVKPTKNIWSSWAPPRALFMFAALAAVSTLWSIAPLITTGAAAALTIAAMLGAATYRRVDKSQLVKVVATLGRTAMVASLILAAIAPGLALEKDRLRGVFENANGLGGFVVVTLPAVLFAASPKGRVGWTLLAFAISVGTASRASTAALVVQIVVVLCMGAKSTGRKLLLVAVGLLLAIFVASGALEAVASSLGLQVVRSNNSRGDTWALGMRYFWEHPWLGTGVDAVAPGAIGGIVPTLLAATGIVGTLIVFAIYAAVVVRAYRSGVMLCAMVAGSTVTLMFEPWLITGGSVLCVVFWLLAGHPGFVQELPTFKGPVRYPGGAASGSRLGVRKVLDIDHVAGPARG